MADNQSNIAAAQRAVDELAETAREAIAELKANSEKYFIPYTPLTGFEEVPNWNVDRGRAIDLSDEPEFRKPLFTFNPEDYLNSDLLQRYSYDSDFFNNFLDTRLRTYIDSAGYFLAQTVQDALFEQMRQRDLQTQNDALDMVNRIEARRGFPLPTSMLMAARNDVIKKYQDTQADRNKEVTALIAKLSLEEKLAAIEAGVKMEDIRSRFQLEYGKLYWQAADYIVKKYEVDIRAELAKYESELRVVLAQYEVDKRNAELDAEYEKMDQTKDISRLAAHVDDMKTNFEAWKQETQMRIEAAKFAAEYYSKATLGWLGGVNMVDFVDKSGT